MWRTLRAAACAVVAAQAAGMTAQPATAGDAAAGRQKAIQCQACHGLDGLAKIPGAPHIAGQVEEYLVKSMRAYKSGARPDEMMTVVMRLLSEDDIADLAAYYAALGGASGSDSVGPASK
jgi:cytochrome c553